MAEVKLFSFKACLSLFNWTGGLILPVPVIVEAQATTGIPSKDYDIAIRNISVDAKDRPQCIGVRSWIKFCFCIELVLGELLTGDPEVQQIIEQEAEAEWLRISNGKTGGFLSEKNT